MKEVIVVEIIKCWPAPQQEDLISKMFEKVINENSIKGYHLHSWQLGQVSISMGVVTQTIMAIFAAAADVTKSP